MGRCRVLAAALVVLAGCSSSPEPGPIGADGTESPEPTSEPTVPDEPEETEPPEDDDPWAVPDEIDEDYVEAVLNEIYARNSELNLAVLESELDPSASPSEAHVRQLAALFAGPAGRREATHLVRLVTEEDVRDAQLPPEDYGRQRFDVARLERVEPRCVTVLGWYDLTETAVRPYEPDEYAALVLAYDEAAVDPELNPTGWRIWDRVLLTTPEGEPISLDQVSEENLEPAIDLGCEDE